MPNYGDQKYWEDRYKSLNGATFDWLEDYDTLKDLISEINNDKGNAVIMNLGCGNAELEEKMYDDGYKNIVNIDISEHVIKFKQERNVNRKELHYEVMDVRDIKYPDKYFDMVIDKSTIDALLCGDKSFVNVAKMLNEVQRILKEGGVYMIISYGSPEYRIFHLDREHLNFDLTIYTIKKDYFVDEDHKNFVKTHYVYLCKKKPGSEEISKANFEYVINTLEAQEKCEEEINTSKDEADEEEFLGKKDTENIYNLDEDDEEDMSECTDNIDDEVKYELFEKRLDI